MTGELGVTISRSVLDDLLDKAGAVVPSKDIFPVLKNYLIEATESKLVVTGSDMSQFVITSTTDVQVDKPGRVVIPAKRLSQMVKSSDSGKVVIDVQAYQAVITCGNASWQLHLQQGVEYPELPPLGDLFSVSVNREQLLRSVQKSKYATSSDVNRPELQLVDIRNGVVTATDGLRFQRVRLAAERTSFGHDPLDELAIQIPVSSVDNLIELLKDSKQEQVSCVSSSYYLIFFIGQDAFISAKSQAKFPADIEDLLASPVVSNRNELVCDRKQLLAVLKRARITADVDTVAVTLNVTSVNSPAILEDVEQGVQFAKLPMEDKEGLVCVTARDKYGNSSKESIKSAWSGGEQTIIINYEHLRQALGVLEGTEVTIRLGNDTKTRRNPVVIEDTEQGLVAVLAQLRVEI